MMNEQSRRAFLGSAAIAAPAMAAGATLGDEPPATLSPSQVDGSALAGKSGSGKRIVSGSPYPTFSRAVILDGTVYVSGVLGQLPGTTTLASLEFGPQCRQAMENLKASVEAAGSSMNEVVKCQCFLTEASDFAAFNKIYVGYFPKDPPARSTVIVKALVAKGAKIEIDCFAALP